MPICKWSVARDALVITVGANPTFTLDSHLVLTQLQGVEVHKIHVSRVPSVLVPRGPAFSDLYDGASQTEVELVDRARDGMITDAELAAAGLAQIPTDGSPVLLDPELGLDLLPQLSYLFQPTGSCPETDDGGGGVCPMNFKLEMQEGVTLAHPLVKIDGEPSQDECASKVVFDARRSTGSLGRAFKDSFWALLSYPETVIKRARPSFPCMSCDSCCSVPNGPIPPSACAHSSRTNLPDARYRSSLKRKEGLRHKCTPPTAATCCKPRSSASTAIPLPMTAFSLARMTFSASPSLLVLCPQNLPIIVPFPLIKSIVRCVCPRGQLAANG